MSVSQRALIVGALVAIGSATLQHAAVADSAEAVTLFIAATRSVGGDPVIDLRKEDVEVIVDGKPCEVTEFSPSGQSVSIAVLLDLSASMDHQWSFEALVRALGANLGPDDRMSVEGFGPQAAAHPVFTRDARVLDQTTRDAWQRRLPFAGPSPLWDSANVAVTALERQNGRRALVLFTDGRATGDLTPFGAVARHALLANVEVSVLGAWGGGGRGGARSIPQIETRDPYRRTGLMPPSGRLRQIADLTGGLVIPLDFTFTPNRAYMGRVVRELKAEYLVRFRPGVVDGRPHAIEVRVTRRGVLVRARTTYE
jgi:VWFA-related protein